MMDDIHDGWLPGDAPRLNAGRGPALVRGPILDSAVESSRVSALVARVGHHAPFWVAGWAMHA